MTPTMARWTLILIFIVLLTTNSYVLRSIVGQ